MAKLGLTITEIKASFPFKVGEEGLGLVIEDKNKRYTYRVRITDITGNTITWQKLTKNGYVIGSSTFSDYGCKAKYFVHLNPEIARKIDEAEEGFIEERVKPVYTQNPAKRERDLILR